MGLTREKVILSEEVIERNIEYAIDGIKYYLDEESHTAIARSIISKDYTGVEEFVIPGEINKDGKTYKVIAFGLYEYKNNGDIGMQTTIYNTSFSYCSNLKNLILSENIEYIGLYVVDDSQVHIGTLENLYIPSTAKEVSWNMMEPIFDKIMISSENPLFCREDNFILSKDKETLIYVNKKSLKSEFSIPNGIKTIADCALTTMHHDLDVLNEVILPEGLEEIGSDNLRSAANIEKVVFPSSLRQIKSGSFYNTKNFKDIRLPLKLRFLGNHFKSATYTTELVENGEDFVDVFMIPINVDLAERRIDNQGILFDNESQIIVYTAGADNVSEYVDLLIGSTSKYGFKPQVARVTIKNIEVTSELLHTTVNNEINLKDKFSAPLVFYRNSSGEEEIPNEEVQADDVLSTVDLPLDYKVIGNTSSLTSINDKGILKIGKNESAEYITVQASYYLNQDVNAEIQILIDKENDEPEPDQDQSNGSHSSSGTGKTDKVQPGWIKKDGVVSYIDQKGNKITGFYNIEDEHYFFDKSGALIKNDWIIVQDKRYYAQDEGIIVKGWLLLENNKYYMSEEDGHMITEWTKIGNNWYFFDPITGKMWQNQWAPGDKGNWYYVDMDGKMMVDTWIPSHSGFWYYVDADGKMAVNTTVNGYSINSLGIYKSLIYSD